MKDSTTTAPWPTAGVGIHSGGGALNNTQRKNAAVTKWFDGLAENVEHLASKIRWTRKAGRRVPKKMKRQLDERQTVLAVLSEKFPHLKRYHCDHPVFPQGLYDEAVDILTVANVLLDALAERFPEVRECDARSPDAVEKATP